MEFLHFVKEYWFLITLIISVITAGLYMLVFHVTPWDTYRQMSERKRAVATHLKLGKKLLDLGHYKQALAEYEHSLRLDPANPEALEGKRKADMFLQVDAVEWKPGEAVAYKDVFSSREDHHILHFMGILSEKIGDSEAALGYYEQARLAYQRVNPDAQADYYAALFNIGWLKYSRKKFDEMERCFEKMCQLAEFDYRGFHGRGYALYMKAVHLANTDGAAAVAVLQQATDMLYSAQRYVPNILVINTDIGEVTRIIDPDFSIRSHQRAMDCIRQDELYNLHENQGTIFVTLLCSDHDVWLTNRQEKIAWVTYLLALDHYAKAKRFAAGDSAMREHDRLVKEAGKYQETPGPRMLYDDQKIIMDRFLAGLASAGH